MAKVLFWTFLFATNWNCKMLYFYYRFRESYVTERFCFSKPRTAEWSHGLSIHDWHGHGIVWKKQTTVMSKTFPHFVASWSFEGDVLYLGYTVSIRASKTWLQNGREWASQKTLASIFKKNFIRKKR